MTLYLASGSPRRAELLRQIGVPYTPLQAPGIDETPISGEKPLDYVRRMAKEKAAAGASRVNQGVVLGADTAVVMAGDILGKPDTDSQALAMLQRLNGNSHEVISAVCLGQPGAWRQAHSITQVHWRQVSEATLQHYVATGEGADKAGAYAIQGMGAALVASIRGSYSGVVGLPLAETATLLDAAGLLYWQTD